MFLKGKNVRKFLTGAAFLSASLLATGCGNNGSDDNNGNGGVTDGGEDQVTLVMSTWNYDITPEFSVLIEGFEAKYPHINIETIDIASPNYTERIITMLAGGETLDIIPIVDTPLFVNLAERGQLLDISDFVETLDRDAWGGTLDFMSIDGGPYFGVPYRWHFWALFYNKDIFEEAGIPFPENLTWEEYADLALQLTTGEGNDKVYGAHLHTWRSITHGIATAQTGNTQITDDFSFLKDQYEIVLGMQEAGSIMDFGTILAADVGYRPRFELENAAMMLMGSWYLGELAERAEFNWGVAPIPQISEDSEITTIGAPTPFTINTNSNHPEEALKFIEFATGEEGAKLLAEIGIVSAFMNDDILDIYFAVDGMPQDELTRRTFSPDRVQLEMQNSPLTGDIHQILNEEHELIMVGEVSIEEGIQRMNERVGAVLNR